MSQRPSRAAYFRRYYRLNRERLLAIHRRYYLSHREEAKNRSRAWEKANRDKVNAARRRRYRANQIAFLAGMKLPYSIDKMPVKVPAPVSVPTQPIPFLTVGSDVSARILGSAAARAFLQQRI